MKYVYSFLLIIASAGFTKSLAQCNGTKGPNLLGAKGTFSAPFITPNLNASNCTSSGATTYSPLGNIGNALNGCSAFTEPITPCSDYSYTAIGPNGLSSFKYTIINTIGDINGGNCIKPDWRGKEHTGDGGYFMAVNGAPNVSSSPVFYQLKSIPVCIGTTYEFSAWVINLLPAANPGPRVGSEPNISFKVNGVVISNSGPIAYSLNPAWKKVSGTFTATTNTIDIEVVNATLVESGNDLGIDDISINVCQSNIDVIGAPSICNGIADVGISFVVSDPNELNSWYKIQLSTDGGITFNDIQSPTQGVFQVGKMTVPYTIGSIDNSMNGYKYRLVTGVTEQGLNVPGCLEFNEYTLVVVNECGPTPVILTSFTGSYLNGQANLNWQTSQEINSDHFEIFRSIDGMDFYKVGEIKSAGFSNHLKKYSYQENVSTQNNHYYYRLKQVDINGKAVFSSIIKLAVATKMHMNVYPNPFIDKLVISFGATKKATAVLEIRNNFGQVVYKRIINIIKGSNALTIEKLPLLKSGMYNLSVFNEDIDYKTKIVKL